MARRATWTNIWEYAAYLYICDLDPYFYVYTIFRWCIVQQHSCRDSDSDCERQLDKWRCWWFGTILGRKLCYVITTATATSDSTSGAFQRRGTATWRFRANIYCPHHILEDLLFLYEAGTSCRLLEIVWRIHTRPRTTSVWMISILNCGPCVR